MEHAIQGILLTEDAINIGLVEQFLQELPHKALTLGIRVVMAALVFLIGLKLIKLVRKLIKKSLDRVGADKGVTQFLDSLIKIGLTAMLILMIAISFGLDAASVVAMLGSVGVAFALALQGSLSNCAGGVLILLLKPFVVGDYIIEGDKGQEGTVIEIQLFYTKLQTADNMIITLPNGTLANRNIVNYSTMETRRLDVSVGIAYEADLRRAKSVLLGILEKEALVLQDKEKSVYVKELGDCAVILGIRCWLLNADYWNGRAAILEACKIRLDEEGISIPYPQVVVHKAIEE